MLDNQWMHQSRTCGAFFSEAITSSGLVILFVSRIELMGTTYRFLTTVDEASAVLEWFRELPEQPAESVREDGVLFYFRNFGPLDSDAKKSPVVNVFLPVVKRGVLTTIGEVHFLATPLSAFPKLNRINKRFREWLSANPCVYSHKPDFVHEWDYYLEGSAKNWDPDIFALPAGIRALHNGQYFVSGDDNDFVLDRGCQSLELSGIVGLSG
ncbi:MAG: hypothetical protein R3C03_03315 [Pirellulaceae bacterium]